MVLTNNNNYYELYLITDQREEHNGTPLHKTMFYSKLILFKQAGAPSRYGPRSKYRLRPCSRALVGAAEDWTQASRMRDKDLSIELLLLSAYYSACVYDGNLCCRSSMLSTTFILFTH